MYELPGLPYAYDALAPAISEDIMRLHHQGHHKTYVDKLNRILDSNPKLKTISLIDLLAQVNSLPNQYAIAVRNQGGGHYNHSLFWQCMSPDGGGEPNGRLAEAITAKWGSFSSFVDEFTTAASSLFGSGWVWLTKDLEIIALPNQDTTMMLQKGEPLMGLDVWEHAYYIDYRNKRDEYIHNWWSVLNWRFIESRFEQ